MIRQRTAAALTCLLAATPEAGMDPQLVTALFARIEDPAETVRVRVVRALAAIASGQAGEQESLDQLAGDDPGQDPDADADGDSGPGTDPAGATPEDSVAAALQALGTIASADPDVVTPVIDLVSSYLATTTTRQPALQVIATVAQARPAALRSSVDAIVDRLRDPETRGLAIETLVAIARAEPTALEDETAALVAVLADDDPEVRRLACQALGALRDEGALERLRELRDDPDYDVRVAAESAIRAIEAAGSTDTDEPAVGQQDRTRAARGVPGRRPDGAAGSPSVDSDGIATSATEFERHKQIGAGGTADVYEATIEIDGRDQRVALKVPRTERTLTRETAERFVAEAETWARIDDDPHIVAVIDWGIRPEPWIAMEYMDAGDLASREDVAFEAAVRIGLAVAQALRHAHRHGVAHLDLTPGNVLFARRADGTPVPKVTDWGLAAVLIEQYPTVEGYTADYAAPEQVDPDTYGGPDDYTDIYQLGVVLYELFTGELPHGGQPTEIGVPPPPPTTVEPTLPSQVDALLLPALATEKSDRYETIVHFREALEAFL